MPQSRRVFRHSLGSFWRQINTKSHEVQASQYNHSKNRLVTNSIIFFKYFWISPTCFNFPNADAATVEASGQDEILGIMVPVPVEVDGVWFSVGCLGAKCKRPNQLTRVNCHCLVVVVLFLVRYSEKLRRKK